MTDRQAFTLGVFLGAGIATLSLARAYRSWKGIG